MYPLQTSLCTLYRLLCVPLTDFSVYPLQISLYTLYRLLCISFTDFSVYPLQTSLCTLYRLLFIPFTDFSVYPLQTSLYTLYRLLCVPFTRPKLLENLTYEGGTYPYIHSIEGSSAPHTPPPPHQASILVFKPPLAFYNHVCPL